MREDQREPPCTEWVLVVLSQWSCAPFSEVTAPSSLSEDTFTGGVLSSHRGYKHTEVSALRLKIRKPTGPDRSARCSTI